MSFKSAYLKLTIFYVLIVMTISIIFSISLYQISSKEIERGLGRQNNIFRELQPRGNLIPDLEDVRSRQVNESNIHLRNNLIYFNLLILILSSAISYFLAKQTLKPIEEMVEAQNRFTADASHELKTPLTAMKAEIEVGLRNQKLKLPNSKKLLSSNLEEIEKLESLSNALLMLARYQEKQELEFEKISLSEIITEAYEKVEKMANNKSIKFRNDFGEIYVSGDRQSLVELFVIFLDNAIKYSPKKSIISINIKQKDGFAVVEIADQGIGIKSSSLPYIFDRFYRADQSRNKEKTDGYGLGLSIAKRIVELHKGKILAYSKPGKGSRFKILIPIY